MLRSRESRAVWLESNRKLIEKILNPSVIWLRRPWHGLLRFVKNGERPVLMSFLTGNVVNLSQRGVHVVGLFDDKIEDGIERIEIRQNFCSSGHGDFHGGGDTVARLVAHRLIRILDCRCGILVRGAERTPQEASAAVRVNQMDTTVIVDPHRGLGD